MVTQKQRSESTRSALLEAARESLISQGLEATTTASILAATGLSKGALYHHFRSKTEIVEALYTAESRGAIDRALATVDPAAPPLERLREACLAWLREVQDTDIAKILFVLGPEALGLIKAKQIEDRNSLSVFESLLEEAGSKDPVLVARLLNALMAEASLVARSANGIDYSTLGRVIDAVIQSLRASAHSSGGGRSSAA